MKLQKIIFIVFVIMFYHQASFAQGSNDSWYNKTLADFGNIYFGISNEMGDFLGSESYFWGFDLGLYLYPFKGNMKNTAIKIGLGGAWLDNSISRDLQTNERYLSYPINLKLGGIRTGLIFYSDKLFVPSFDILIASGNLSYQIPENVFNSYKDDVQKQTVPIYILMPKLNLEIKITENIKFGWGLSYRIVKGIDVPWANNTDASNIGYHGTFISVF